MRQLVLFKSKRSFTKEELIYRHLHSSLPLPTNTLILLVKLGIHRSDISMILKSRDSELVKLVFQLIDKHAWNELRFEESWLEIHQVLISNQELFNQYLNWQLNDPLMRILNLKPL